MKKRLLTVALAVALLAVSVACFAACGKVTKCDLCGQEARCKEVTILGEKGWACSDCKKGMDELKDVGDSVKDGIEDIGKELGDLFD